jgi:recombination DNA repair RAD52 pathway protein
MSALARPGHELTYIEGWYAMTEANRIFGFDGWDKETVESHCALARETCLAEKAIRLTKVLRAHIFAHENGSHPAAGNQQEEGNRAA